MVIVIGAMKCGTTSLHTYLDSHPDIRMSRKKELDFFIAERNWKRGIGWYESQLPRGAPWAGESSPNYTKFPEFAGVPARMASVVPNAKLIYIVRHPLKRAVSSYIHGVSRGWERRSVDEALGDPENSVHVMPSCYHLQISQYLQHYDLSNIFVSTLERMESDRRGLLRDILRFLDVDPNIEDNVLDQKRNLSSGRSKPTPFTRTLLRWPGGRYVRELIRSFVEPEIGPVALADNTRIRLHDFLEQDVQKFRTLTGLSLSEWSPDF